MRGMVIPIFNDQRRSYEYCHHKHAQGQNAEWDADLYPTDLLKIFGLGVVDAGGHKRYLFFDLFAHFVETPFLNLIVNFLGYTFDFTTIRILCPP